MLEWHIIQTLISQNQIGMRSSSNLSWYPESVIVQQKRKTKRLLCYVETQTTLKLVVLIVHLITLVHIPTQLGSGFIIKHSFCCKNFVMILTFRKVTQQCV